MSSDSLNTQLLLKEARNFQAKKNLGQHFLIDCNALDIIVEALDLKANDQVIEIGSGIGFLTRLLCKTKANICAVDLDRKSIDYLKKLDLPNTILKHGDFLNFNLRTKEFFLPTKDNQTTINTDKIKIVGNVPYQITGLLIGHILGEIGKPAPWLSQIDCIVLTIQREVALRMLAKPGNKEYSQISLLIQYFTCPSLIQLLEPSCFYPPPAVHSAVIKLIPHKELPVLCSNHKLLRQLIKAGFSQRRKMLKNTFNTLKLTQENIDYVFKKQRLNPLARAENLSLEQFAMLTNAFDEILKDDKKCSGVEGKLYVGAMPKWQTVLHGSPCIARGRGPLDRASKWPRNPKLNKHYGDICQRQ